jgi:hypothetical protein
MGFEFGVGDYTKVNEISGKQHQPTNNRRAERAMYAGNELSGVSEGSGNRYE